MTSTADRATADVDLDISARSFWAKPFEEREKTFAWLRANQPVAYQRPYESTLVPPDEDTPGFWSLSKYDDIQGVSRNAELVERATQLSTLAQRPPMSPPEARVFLGVGTRQP